VSRLPVVLPPVEGTLQTVADHLHGWLVKKVYMLKIKRGSFPWDLNFK
jgi:hypothetical protein